MGEKRVNATSSDDFHGQRAEGGVNDPWRRGQSPVQSTLYTLASHQSSSAEPASKG